MKGISPADDSLAWTCTSPGPSAPLGRVHVLLVPALAFESRTARLGMRVEMIRSGTQEQALEALRASRST